MNLFIVDYDINKCIQSLPDKHIVKMPVESTQLLCAAYYILDQANGLEGKIYKPSHLKHPCALWAAESSLNWDWLKEYTIKLGEEYTFRYGKSHKSVELAKHLTKPIFNKTEMTAFVKCVPEEFRELDVVEAYRQYFIYYKQHIKRYTGRDIPSWFIDIY